MGHYQEGFEGTPSGGHRQRRELVQKKMTLLLTLTGRRHHRQGCVGESRGMEECQRLGGVKKYKSETGN